MSILPGIWLRGNRKKGPKKGQKEEKKVSFGKKAPIGTLLYFCWKMQGPEGLFWVKTDGFGEKWDLEIPASI